MIVTVALLAHLAHAVTGVGGEQADTVLGELLYSGLVFAAAAACGLRAANVKTDRAAWLALGGGLGAWGLGSTLSGLNR